LRIKESRIQGARDARQRVGRRIDVVGVIVLVNLVVILGGKIQAS
jgi:hypothetical protein